MLLEYKIIYFIVTIRRTGGDSYASLCMIANLAILICFASWLRYVRSFIARYPVFRTVQTALHFTLWQTCTIEHHLDFSRKS